MFSVPLAVEILLRHADNRAESLRHVRVSLQCELTIMEDTYPWLDDSYTTNAPWKLSLHVGREDGAKYSRIIEFPNFDHIRHFLETGETLEGDDVAFFDDHNKLVKREGRGVL